MIWLIFIVLIFVIITIAVILERKGENKFNDGDFTIEEKAQIDNDYIKNGEHHETDRGDKI
ncbi:hypothetical protein [Aquibacillus saliphilus]|uniref:hypothetical protein n=1 Tax=Aquibacillus saliphilus TaxID=1909422 RepID=UPI001CF067AE|nr:hypothetical protein [Aquibacillus saliphilus]